MKNLKKICNPRKIYVVLLRGIQYFIESSLILLFRQILKLSKSCEAIYASEAEAVRAEYILSPLTVQKQGFQKFAAKLM